MKKLIPAIVIGATALSGCSYEDQIDHEAVNLEVARSINTDVSNTSELLAELRKGDQSIVDAYLSGDVGSRILNVARVNAAGEIQTAQFDYDSLLEKVPKKENEQQEATDGGSNLASTLLTSAAIGALAGYMASSLANRQTSYGSPVNRSVYDRERERSRSAYVNSAAGSYRSSYVSQVKASNAAKSANAGKSTNGSFGSTGSRSGGYSGGRAGGSAGGSGG